MKGKVLQYDDVSGTGLISGDDGKRYRFSRGELQSGLRVIPAGVDVDFDADGQNATGVFAMPGSVGSKSKVAAILLALFLGGFGVHKFYLGRIWAGLFMLIFFWTFIPAIIALIELVIYITKSDVQFHQDYVVNRRSWF